MSVNCELACTQAVRMVEKTGILNKVAILDSHGWLWAGLRVDKASEGRGALVPGSARL